MQLIPLTDGLSFYLMTKSRTLCDIAFIDLLKTIHLLGKYFKERLQLCVHVNCFNTILESVQHAPPVTNAEHDKSDHKFVL